MPRVHLQAEDGAGRGRLMSVAASPQNRPRRWDVPFSKETSDVDVRRLLGIRPFKDMDCGQLLTGNRGWLRVE